MTNSDTSALNSPSITTLQEKLNSYGALPGESGSERSQQQLIEDLLAQGEDGTKVLMEFLLRPRSAPPLNAITTKIYQALRKVQADQVHEFFQQHFPAGIVPLRSDRNIDYLPLRQCLVDQNFQVADQLTVQKMCELAGPEAVQRKWLYFTEVENFPTTDLRTIDTLWRVYSGDQFGFSVQRDLWLSSGKNWEKLWAKIHWKSGNNWTRYPHEFTWDLSAPKGHLPLSNQLRGVRVIAALFNHAAWTA